MESVKINGKTYQISFIDTEDTVKNMVANTEQLPTNYIKFTTYEPHNKKIKVELLSQILKAVPQESLVDEVPELAKTWNVSKADISLEWIAQNRNGKIPVHDIQLQEDLKEIDEVSFWSLGAIETAYKFYEGQKKATLDEIATLVKQESEYRKEYAKYSPVETTKFLQDSVIIEYQIEIDLDPLEAFDNISLTADIPYVRLKTADQVYYKILRTLTPQKDWLDSESTLTFKIKRQNEWGTATINYTSTVEPYTAVMTIESTVSPKKGKQKTAEEEIKNAILGLFSGADIKIKTRKEKGIKGVFAAPELAISKDVFLDLITNEEMISHYLYVDETREVSSQKTVLYLYYSPGESESQILTVFLSEKIATRSDTFYANKELLLFTPYLNVRVARAENLNQVVRFQKAFAVILDIYKKKFSSIVKTYNSLIPGFKSANESVSRRASHTDKRLKVLQAQDAELFVHGYPTSCERKRQPIPIKAKERKEWEKKGQVMNYPTGSKNYFVCTGENEYKFPGLMKNKLSNAEEYPYLPCCYPKNQQTGNKLWNMYLKGTTKTQQAKTSNIVTKKAVGREKLGLLPRNIYYILDQSRPKGVDFYRQGVAFGNNSFIEAVLLALDPDYEKLSNEEKTEYVQNFRIGLAAEELSPVISELYDTDQNKILQDILNPDVYFDSKLFVGLLEEYYQCQIVVFERTDQEPNADYELPRYTQGYLYKKLDPTVKTILIYKHMGIRSDNLEHPHYELIVKKYKKITTWYFQDDNLIRNVYSYFLRSYRLFLIGIGRYTAITIPPESLADAEGQIVDRYGKSRGYIFGKVFIVTSPIAVSDLPIMDLPEERPSFKEVQAFLKKRKLTILEQDIVDEEMIGVRVDFPNIPYVYIPFKATQKLEGYPEIEQLGFIIPTEEDVLKQTVDNRKIADFLMQLMLYKFSLWYPDQPESQALQEELPTLSLPHQQLREKVVLMDLVEEFLKNEIIIVPDHDYNLKNLSRKLTINNSFFADDLLVVDSAETLKKLGYYLRFMITKNKTLVLRYSERTHLDNYYTYAEDFQDRKNQLVFIGGLSISNWIETREHGVSNEVHTIAHPETQEPFFFAHWALNGGKPVIFQNVKDGSLNRALAVSVAYLKRGYNIGFNAKPIKEGFEYTEYFIEEGILKRKKNGVSPISVWRFTDNFYGAIIVP